MSLARPRAALPLSPEAWRSRVRTVIHTTARDWQLPSARALPPQATMGMAPATTPVFWRWAV